jgi:hypothetical protein
MREREPVTRLGLREVLGPDQAIGERGATEVERGRQAD